MKKGTIFEIKENELQGRYSRWATEGNIEKDKSDVPEGRYYISTINEDTYVIGSLHAFGEFTMLGQKNSYFVDKADLEKLQPVDQIPEEELAKTNLITDYIINQR